MAGTLNTSTLMDGSFSAPVVDLVRGGVKAWALMDMTTNPIVIKAQMNITSVADMGVGNYILNFSKPMKNINYGFIGSCLADSNGANVSIGVAMGGAFTVGPTNKSLTSCNLRVGGSNAQYDSKEIFVVVVGD